MVATPALSLMDMWVLPFLAVDGLQRLKVGYLSARARGTSG
jgi:hypothetical protein